MERHQGGREGWRGKGSWQSAPRRSKMKGEKLPGAAERQSEAETGLASRGSQGSQGAWEVDTFFSP